MPKEERGLQMKSQTHGFSIEAQRAEANVLIWDLIKKKASLRAKFILPKTNT